jgi:hypothetical protein
MERREFFDRIDKIFWIGGKTGEVLDGINVINRIRPNSEESS